MAFEWVGKLRKYLPARGDFGSATDNGAYGAPPTGDPTAPPSQLQAWLKVVRGGVPVAMMVVGILLSAFTELVGLWALLGYALLAAAPIVYFLVRVEQRLIELRETVARSGMGRSERTGSRSGSRYD